MVVVVMIILTMMVVMVVVMIIVTDDGALSVTTLHVTNLGRFFRFKGKYLRYYKIIYLVSDNKRWNRCRDLEW